jgi:hypothetical protein
MAPFGYVYRGEAGRKGLAGRLLYGFIVASQFFPSLRTLASARASARQRQAPDIWELEELDAAPHLASEPGLHRAGETLPGAGREPEAARQVQGSL